VLLAFISSPRCEVSSAQDLLILLKYSAAFIVAHVPRHSRVFAITDGVYGKVPCSGHTIFFVIREGLLLRLASLGARYSHSILRVQIV
jgi:hypothetical protein